MNKILFLVLMGFCLCYNDVSAQHGLPITFADWMGKIPAAPANCNAAFSQTTFEGRCVTYHQPAAVEKLKKDEERVRKDLTSAATQTERSKADAEKQAAQAKQQAAQYQDLNTPEMKAKIANMSDAEKMQFAMQMQQRANSSGAVANQPKQENNTAVALLAKIALVNGKLNTEMNEVAVERNKVEEEFAKANPVDDFASCHGACPCIDQKRKQLNQQKADLTDKLILQETAIINEHKVAVTGFLTGIDNYLRDLKYGDLCVDENNKRQIISYQAGELVAVDAFLDLCAGLYERGAKAQCEVKNPVVCTQSDPCFAGTARVTMADGSHKNIMDVQVGEKIKAYNIAANNITITTVTGKSIHTEGGYQLYRLGGTYNQLWASSSNDISFENSIELMATANHPVYVKYFGWKCLEDLHNGDELLRNAENDKPRLFKVNNVCKFATAGTVYSLQTEAGNFFVEETLVKAK